MRVALATFRIPAAGTGFRRHTIGYRGASRACTTINIRARPTAGSRLVRNCRTRVTRITGDRVSFASTITRGQFVLTGASSTTVFACFADTLIGQDSLARATRKNVLVRITRVASLTLVDNAINSVMVFVADAALRITDGRASGLVRRAIGDRSTGSACAISFDTARSITGHRQILGCRTGGTRVTGD